MVKRLEIDSVLAALADPTRRHIVERLAAGEQSVGELSAGLTISAPAISKHVKILERCGLLKRRLIGRQHRCRLGVQSLTKLSHWIDRQERYWNAALDRLTALAEGDKK
jgi:DNA-binding transcriptional ArsR family regulator